MWKRLFCGAIEGHPAKKLSFSVQRADFVRPYQNIDGFWLPQKDQTLVQVRLYGKKVLTIERRDYMVNAGQRKRGSGNRSRGRHRLTSLHRRKRMPRASGNNAPSQLPHSGWSTRPTDGTASRISSLMIVA
jgi:hypothetical protein